MDRETEKWKLKSDGLVRQMERMDKAFQERANTLQVKLSAQGKLTRETLKRNRELEEELETMRDGDITHFTEYHIQVDRIKELEGVVKSQSDHEIECGILLDKDAIIVAQKACIKELEEEVKDLTRQLNKRKDDRKAVLKEELETLKEGEG